jgi:hypothetical protein
MTAQQTNPRFPVEPKGRGFGKFIEGECITCPAQVQVGDLVTEYNSQFHACNLIRVTGSSAGSNFHGMIVDPVDPFLRGAGTMDDICFWDWEFNINRPDTFKSVLHRAVLPIEPLRRLELQSSDFKTAVEASDTPQGRQMLMWFAARNGSRFMLRSTNPCARLIHIVQRQPQLIPLLVEHFTA